MAMFTGAFSADGNKMYYFFRGNKHCLRKLKVDGKDMAHYEKHHYSEAYKMDAQGNMQMISQSGVSRGEGLGGLG